MCQSALMTLLRKAVIGDVPGSHVGTSARAPALPLRYGCVLEALVSRLKPVSDGPTLDRGRQLAELPCCVKHPESFTAANPCAPTCDGWGDIPWAHGKVLGCTVWMLLSVTNSSAATAKGAYTCLVVHSKPSGEPKGEPLPSISGVVCHAKAIGAHVPMR